MKVTAKVMVVPLVALLVAVIPYGFASPSTVPAFVWSPYLSLFPDKELKEAVNYQIIPSKDLAKSVLTEAGWSNILCTGKKLQKPLDLAVVFVGSKLQSSDISASKHADQPLLEMLKASFTGSNFSLAFPYVSASEEEAMENLLVSGFAENCVHSLEMRNVALIGSCSIEDGNNKKNVALGSVQEYLVSRMKERHEEQTDLVVFCSSGSHSAKLSESEIFSDLISSVEQSGAKYVVLYVSDPFRSIQYPSYRQLERFLAEGAPGNGSVNSTLCDEVCQIKSSLLEGVFVGIVLLIILISGLCCMMGIDTPTRFETPQD
ncbi:2-C-methyl-D-erythritol 4-phosphate cytidylyltransferase [Quillaja saponaria]|uniref:2-C-methyl-D-erythritol 4-phosphate cytidylyltransferase n=1 Tax=Quillaja saponaria TaxID=32244 RepID=A0AAD7LC98_QUISA|nr:2-C-methyl-D-erythritol 4-phosphate cytidylyltransferase [Quillaja saponaria]